MSPLFRIIKCIPPFWLNLQNVELSVAFITKSDLRRNLGLPAISFDAMIQNKSIQQPTEPLHLIMIEHPHVYTFGKSADRENLLATDEALTAMEAKVYDIERGGDITYHGPGQLVVYPIFDLEALSMGVKRFVEGIETTIIKT